MTEAVKEAKRKRRPPTAGPPRPFPDLPAPPYVAAAFAGLGAFLLYVVTLAPTTAFWDTSEYIATAHIVGIPHPPGNPLFVMLGRVWSILLEPTGASVAVRINLFAAATSAGATGFFYLVAHRVLLGFLHDDRYARIGAFASAMLGATAFTVWNQSNVNEKVYTLSVLIIAAVSWLAVRWYDRRDEEGSERYILWAVFWLAIGSTNHMMSVLPAPALAVMLVLAGPTRLLRPEFVGRALLLGILGLSFSFVLPIRASLDPVVNEGDPTCESVVGAAAAIYTHGRAGCPALGASLRREQYQTPPIYERKAPYSAQLGTYLQYFEWQWSRGIDATETPVPARLPFTLLYLALGAVGLMVAWRSDRVLCSYLFVLAGTLTLGLVVYLNFRHGFSLHADLDVQREVRERDYFFVAGFMLWGSLAGMGLTWLWHTFANALGGGSRRYAMTAPVLLIALIPLGLNWSWASRAGDYAARDWAYDLLMSVEPYGILFTNGDNDTFPLWYLQEVEEIRRDVTVVVGQYLQTTWYPRQLQQLTSPENQRPFDPTLVPGLHEDRALPELPLTVLDPDLMDNVSSVRLAEDLTVSFPRLAVTYPAGMVLDRIQQIALRIINDSAVDRPIFFSSSAGLMSELGLDRWGVQHGLTTKLELRNLETDPNEGLVQVAPEYGSDWFDLEQSLKLYDEVYTFRGLRDRPIWQDRSTLMMPWQYYVVALQLSNAVTLAGLDPELAQRLQEDATAFQVVAQGGILGTPGLHRPLTVPIGGTRSRPGGGTGMTHPELGRDELYRYARHLALPEMGMDGQTALKAGRVLCVGAGGLGSPLAMYLAAAGVGTIGLVDFDVVDESNLQRQLLHGTSDVGRSKLESATERLADLNPHVEVVGHPVRLSSENALDIFDRYDIVVDGTDNFPTRYLVNDACVLLGKPNVYGSVFRWEGQASVFATNDGPCYRCLFREPPPPGLVPNCAEGGVLGVLPGIIGSVQAMETIKLLLGVGTSLAGRLLIFDALEMSWREVALRRNPDCPVCGDRPTQTGLIDYEIFCGLASDPSDTDAVPSSGVVAEITPAALAARLDADEPPFLLDVREPWEWAVSSLADRGARLIPLSELDDRLAEVPVGRPVVVYCAVGQRSLTAAARLTAAGRGSVESLAGGLRAWSETVDPDLRVV